MILPWLARVITNTSINYQIPLLFTLFYPNIMKVTVHTWLPYFFPDQQRVTVPIRLSQIKSCAIQVHFVNFRSNSTKYDNYPSIIQYVCSTRFAKKIVLSSTTILSVGLSIEKSLGYSYKHPYRLWKPLRTEPGLMTRGTLNHFWHFVQQLQIWTLNYIIVHTTTCLEL